MVVRIAGAKRSNSYDYVEMIPTSTSADRVLARGDALVFVGKTNMSKEHEVRTVCDGEEMEIRHIDSLDMKELEIYTKYSEAELLHLYEPDGGVFIAETPDIVSRAIDRGCEPVSFLVEEKVLCSETAGILEPFPDVPVYAAPLDVINKITGFHLTRGMLCVMRRPKMPALEDLLEGAERLVVLEDIENPTNVGAIFRSAAALGADGVILAGGCADPFYRRCARVSMGAVFFIPWVRTKSAPLPKLLREKGFCVVSMALTDRALPIGAPALGGIAKQAVVFGNERTGISEGMLAGSDFTVRIPMKNGIDSLNVAAASAIACYRFFNQDFEEEKGC